MRTVNKLFGCLIVTLGLSVPGIAQDYVEWMYNPGDRTLEEILDAYDAFAEGKNPDEIPMYKQFNRWVLHHYFRQKPDGTIANSQMRNYLAERRFAATQRKKRAPGGHWVEMGPRNYKLGSHPTAKSGGHGRVNCITFHPTNANIIYIGTPAGGVWRTMNGGTTWTPLTDGLPIGGVSGIALKQSNPNVIYILTGDGDGSNTYSTGVLKSIDGGGTWIQTGLTWGINQQVNGYKIIGHPSDFLTYYVASDKGLFKTSNGGINWDMVGTGEYSDIEFKPGSDSTMYAAFLPGSGTGTGFRKSVDAGDTWVTSTSGVLPTTDFSRICIAVTPIAPGNVYLLYGGGSTGFRGLYSSNTSGDSWSFRSNSPNIMAKNAAGTGTGHQVPYDIALAVDPANTLNIFTGGINIWHSVNGGSIWSLESFLHPEPNATGFVHADIHALEYNNGELYVASDGGIAKTNNNGTTWTNISGGLAIRQFYHIDYENGILIGGTQDNGTSQWNTSSPDTGQIVLGSDGMACLINPVNTDIRYVSSQSNRWKTTDAGMTFTKLDDSIPGGDVINDIWWADWIMDPTSPDVLFMGEQDVYRTTNGGINWDKIHDFTSGRWVLSMVQGVNNKEILFATNGSLVMRSGNAKSSPTPVWSDWSGNLPSSSISCLTIDPSNANRIWASRGGYVAGSKVYSTSDGITWANESLNLPNVPINKIVYEPGSADGLYVATDIGIYYKNDTIGEWQPYMNGLPLTRVDDIIIEDGYVFAATYGRGIWRSTTYGNCALAYSLTPANDPSNPLTSGIQLYQALTTINSSRSITGGYGTDVTYQAGTAVTLTPGFEAQAQSTFVARIGQCRQ